MDSTAYRLATVALAHAGGLIRVQQKILDTAGQTPGIPRLNQHPESTILQHLRVASHAGCDDRLSRGHGLQQGI